MNRVAPLLFLAVFATAAVSAPLQPVHGVVQREKAAAIETLRTLVEVESGSRDKEGLDRIAAVLQDRLAALGGKVEVIEPGADAVKLFDTPPQIGKIVVARFQGSGTPKILLLAHMDTVSPRGTLARRPFRIEGSRAFGPGVADEKGGVTLVLHALSVLKAIEFRD